MYENKITHTTSSTHFESIIMALNIDNFMPTIEKLKVKSFTKIDLYILISIRGIKN